ncbi:MAG: sigma-70 family RNA polymerase sigma factor [Bacteroidetes bacterium]|nr:sigma-70 family RNA polymerase sigma factor [Bacteroidota bacterium]
MKKEEDCKDLFRGLATTEGQTAFWALHKLFFHPLFRLIFSIVKQHEIAEELTNDVFVQIWKSREKMNGVENPKSYLFVCAKNQAFSYLRSVKKQVVCIDDLDQFELQVERSPEDLFISSEMLSRLNAEIDRLPVKCKLVFLLVKEYNLKYREAAEVLGISQKTVEAQMSIAIRKLSQSIPLALSIPKK